jgi:hypothetical protein
VRLGRLSRPPRGGEEIGSGGSHHRYRHGSDEGDQSAHSHRNKRKGLAEADNSWEGTGESAVGRRMVGKGVEGAEDKILNLVEPAVEGEGRADQDIGDVAGGLFGVSP